MSQDRAQLFYEWKQARKGRDAERHQRSPRKLLVGRTHYTTIYIMTDNINEPSLTDIILDLKDDFIYLRSENLRLQEENNQLKQAIAALNGEPTNSL